MNPRTSNLVIECHQGIKDKQSLLQQLKVKRTKCLEKHVQITSDQLIFGGIHIQI